MAYYRCYFLDRSDRHIRTFRAFEAEDDFAAVERAERWRGVHPMELWCHHRKVKHWEGVLRQAAGVSPCPASPPAWAP